MLVQPDPPSSQKAGPPRAQANRTPVEVGDVVDLAESEYCYGTGRLILRIAEIGGLHRFDDGLWIALRGTELRQSGRVVGKRAVLARVEGLAQRRRPDPVERPA